jgi:hypothetical protein
VHWHVVERMERSSIVSPGEYICEVAEEWAQQYRKSVRPLFQADFASELEGLGSAVLLKRSDHRMLVTAHHVPENARSDGSSVYVGLQDVGDIIELPERTVGYSGPGDIAVFADAEPLLQDIPAANFIDLDVHIARGPTASRLCFVLGYRAAPRALNLHPEEHKARSEMFFYCGTVQQKTGSNLYVRVDYKKVRHGRMRQQTGELHGISGGAVFEFDPLSPAIQPLFAGIVTQHRRRERHLVCTSTNVIRQLLEQVE